MLRLPHSPRFLLLSALVCFAANSSALEKSPCPILLAPPTAAELGLSNEERIAQLYVRLLDQFRNTSDEEKYVQFLEESLRSGKFYDLKATSSAETSLSQAFSKVKDLHATEKLPNGENFQSNLLDTQIRAHLEKELNSIRGISETIEKSIQTKEEVLETGFALEGAYGNNSSGIQISTDLTQAMSTSSDGWIVVWDFQKKTVLRKFNGEEKWGIAAFRANPELSKAVIGTRNSGIRVVDLQTGKTLRTLLGHLGSAEAMVVSSDFTQVMASDVNGLLRIWNLDSMMQVWPFNRGRPVRTLRGGSSRGGSIHLEANSSFTRALSANGNATLSVLDLKNGDELVHMQGLSGGIQAVKTNTGFNRVMAASGHGVIQVWDLETGKELLKIETFPGDLEFKHSHKIDFLQFSPDSTRALAAYADGTIRMWNLEDGKLLKTGFVNTYQSKVISISEDFSQAVSSTPGSLRFWNLKLQGLGL